MLNLTFKIKTEDLLLRRVSQGKMGLAKRFRDERKIKGTFNHCRGSPWSQAFSLCFIMYQWLLGDHDTASNLQVNYVQTVFSVSHSDFSSISSALLPFFAQRHRSHHSIKIKLGVMTCSCGSQTLLTPTLNPLLHLSPAVEPQATPGHHTLLCGLFFLSPLSVRPFLCFCLC